jgi:hypothetical protein
LDKSSSSKASLSVQAIVLAEVFWAVAALLFFLLGGISLSGQSEPPFWYNFGTSLFELVAFLVASILCLRNWNSSQIVSGRNVWLCIGLGLFFYFIGSLLFTYWETGLGQNASVSPGDLLYIPAYIFLIIGMVQAVITRRLNLEIWQWGIVCLIGLVGAALAALVSMPTTTQGLLTPGELLPPAVAQTAPVASPTKPAVKPTPKATPKADTKASPTAAPAVKPSPTAAPAPAPAAPAIQSPVPINPESLPLKTAPGEAAKTTAPPAPAWAVAIEQKLAPLKAPLDWYYVISDIFLLIVATTLLLAFWGGRFAQSWRLIAAAAFCQYIADMWFKYATNQLENYQSGGLLEVFWVFSGVLFGIGAALEYDLSSRARSRTGSRRRAS